MNKIHLLFVAIFSLMSIAFTAQTETSVIQKNGLSIIKIKTVEGTVVVNLPQHIYAGDIISGTVIAEPKKMNKPKATKKEKEAATNELEKLMKSGFTLFGHKIINSDQIFSFIVPENVSENEKLSYFQYEMEPVRVTHINVLTVPRNVSNLHKTKLPPFLRSGNYEYLTGNFDGDLSNTQVSINDQNIVLVAETPNELVISIPNNMSGNVSCEIQDKNWMQQEEIQILDLQLQTDNPMLKKGESTHVHLQVLGLQEIDHPVIVQVENLTPNQIQMKYGNIQELTIVPEDIDENGIYNHTIKITANLAGSYTISAEILSQDFLNEDPVPIEDNIPTTENPKETNKDDIENQETPEQITPDSFFDIEYGVNNPNDKTQESDKLCGNIWYSDWRVISHENRIAEQEKTLIRTYRRRCSRCHASSTFNVYSIPEYRYNTEERDVYQCSMKRGHANYPQSCHGTVVSKETRDVKVGNVLKYEEVEYCEDGHRFHKRWRKK